MPLPSLLPDEPRTDVEFHGDLQISVPRHMGGKRCKSIVVGLRTRYVIDARGSRPREEGVLFESRVELLGGSVDGIILDAGIQRFVCQST
jgi:hypothetical protein